MRFLTTLTAAATFLLHMWLGCCAHHAHAAEGMPCHRHAEKAAGHAHTCHNHGADAPRDDAPEDTPCPAEHCDGSQCVFLSNGKTALAKPTMVAVLPLLANVAMARSGEAPATTVVDTGGGIARPVRLHLLNQVLLI